ncbi:MAG: hypothetical protein PUF35_10980 [Subdoligranulum sp.]|nr:hypothetical protein [Subdoligranulum sp.]
MTSKMLLEQYMAERHALGFSLKTDEGCIRRFLQDFAEPDDGDIPGLRGGSTKQTMEVAHKKYAQPPRHKHLTNPETKKGADLAKNSAKSAPESLGR